MSDEQNGETIEATEMKNGDIGVFNPHLGGHSYVTMNSAGLFWLTGDGAGDKIDLSEGMKVAVIISGHTLRTVGELIESRLS